MSLLSIIVIPDWASAATGPLVITSDTALAEDVDCTALALNAPCVMIAADNVTLDCNNHTVHGPGMHTGTAGILASYRTAIVVRNCNVTQFAKGVWLTHSSASSLVTNTAGANEFGFELHVSSGIAVIGNAAEANADTGFWLVHSNGNRFADNTSDGNYIGFGLFTSHGNTFNRNAARRSGDTAFSLSNSRENVLEDNSATTRAGALSAIFMLQSFSNDNTLIGNTASGGGFLLYFSNRNVLRENRANAGRWGFYVWRASENKLTRNMGNGNDTYGFALVEETSGNTLAENLACGNREFDLFVYGSSMGNIYDKNHFCTSNGPE